tara:strand:+ start:760 stop:966 length:207 start_codon:yes stop_codon:yes gene_type:complete
MCGATDELVPDVAGAKLKLGISNRSPALRVSHVKGLVLGDKVTALCLFPPTAALNKEGGAPITPPVFP